MHGKRKLENTENIIKRKKLSTLSDIVLRFPGVARVVIKELDDKSLMNIKSASREFSTALKNERCYWIRMILSHTNYLKSFPYSWSVVLNKTPVESLRELGIAMYQYKEQNFPIGELRGLSPHHIAALEGKYQLMQNFLTKNTEKNPKKIEDGQTPLHIAARRGNLDICRLIVLNVEDTNPADNNGCTPLLYL